MDTTDLYESKINKQVEKLVGGDMTLQIVLKSALINNKVNDDVIKIAEKLQKENERLKDMINNELEMTLNEKGEIVSIVQNDDNENQSIELLKVLEL